MDNPFFIQGGFHEDERGRLNFFNEFDFSHIKRMYYTEHFSTSVIRAWQAHKIECRWFLCVQGSFTVKLVKIDDFETPANTLKVQDFELNDKESSILYIPKGYANGFQAQEDNSKLMIFSDYVFGVNPNDQVRFDKNKWTTWS